MTPADGSLRARTSSRCHLSTGDASAIDSDTAHHRVVARWFAC
jgi:hypothetical protein